MTTPHEGPGMWRQGDAFGALEWLASLDATQQENLRRAVNHKPVLTRLMETAQRVQQTAIATGQRISEGAQALASAQRRIAGAGRFGIPVPDIGTDGSYDQSLTVRNTGDRAGAEVVQLYLHDPVASVTRPDVRLIGYQRVELAPGEASRVSFRFHTDLSSFTDRSLRRVVEPGILELRLAASSTDVRHTTRLNLTGPVRVLGPDRVLRCETEVSGPA